MEGGKIIELRPENFGSNYSNKKCRNKREE